MTVPQHVPNGTPTSRNVLEEIATVLDGKTLRHLAALADAHRRRPFVDPAATANRLAAILAAGDRPTVGFWRRQFLSSYQREQ